jgi:hypothetical protein
MSEQKPGIYVTDEQWALYLKTIRDAEAARTEAMLECQRMAVKAAQEAVDAQVADAEYRKGDQYLRDWFAVAALERLDGMNPDLPGDPASHSSWPEPQELVRRRARMAYLQADAMLEARK